MTYEDKTGIINKANERGITLNGRPASIGGARLDFARVGYTGDGGSGFEWAWSTAERIIDNGGKFLS